MSANYKAVISICNQNPDKATEIIEAVGKIWCLEYDDTYPFENKLYISGEDCLSGSENDLVNEIAKAVWEANEAYCLIEMELTNLDAVPCNTYIRDEVAYAG